ncbi:hypothetical protein G6F65_011931 [Rhizopus arrhizus]|nr:hypothetical protein G6F65_011931 [Rhizopus arrhizus]
MPVPACTEIGDQERTGAVQLAQPVVQHRHRAGVAQRHEGFPRLGRHPAELGQPGPARGLQVLAALDDGAAALAGVGEDALRFAEARAVPRGTGGQPPLRRRLPAEIGFRAQHVRAGGVVAQLAQLAVFTALDLAQREGVADARIRGGGIPAPDRVGRVRTPIEAEQRGQCALFLQAVGVAHAHLFAAEGIHMHVLDEDFRCTEAGGNASAPFQSSCPRARRVQGPRCHAGSTRPG